MLLVVAERARQGVAVAFEVFQKGSAPLPSVPAVTIQRRGLFSINRTAHALIGEADAIEFLWDAERQLIALRPSTQRNPNAYPARPQTAKTGRGPILVAGTMFTQYYKIDTSESLRYIPELQDGMLIIDVSKPGQPVTSNRARVTDDAEATTKDGP